MITKATELDQTGSLDCAAMLAAGDAALRQGDVLTALAHFQVVSEASPHNTDALIKKIRTLLRVGDVTQAAETCDRLREANETPLVWALHEVVTTLYNAQYPPHYLNIGGGPFFNFTSWLNLESVPSPSNPLPASLSPTTRFPVDDATLHLVYSSHALEHLDDDTVARCLEETRRTLRPDGALIVKLPDFDAALSAWRNDDLSYFSDQKWNYHAITETWGSKGVVDNIDSRASMIFCGFWNRAYGDHFAHIENYGADAYHGPATCDSDTMGKIKNFASPRTIAKALREEIQSSEEYPLFNHRNAWSHEEFAALLNKFGFKLLSTDEKKIQSRYHAVPRISEMSDISTYYLAVPRGAL